MSECESLNIVHLILSRGFAGSERSTAESCNEQVCDHEVALIIRRDHRKNGNSIVDKLDPRVKVIEVPARLFTAKKVSMAIERVQPDVIHCHLRRATRIVARGGFSAVSVSTLHIDVNSHDFLDMSGLICNARWQVESIPKTYKGELFKANNSLVPHRRLSDLEVLEKRQALGLQEGDVLIGAVGRYHHSKGWETLIDAFMTVHSETLKLMFFGSGTDERKLKARAKNDPRIHFVGYQEDIKDIYQCMDILVCPSRFEPLPRVMLEAMDAGAPIIASDAGGCKELIVDYGGDMFAVDDTEQLAAILLRRTSNIPPRFRPDLSQHYIHNANAGIVGFYRALIATATATTR
ncbi:MAG: glycosyltransferase involved in cell wall biosynthesis [Flavobacteriales bacterium]|jgi:glycosyltransferase involved in cell wall biosynthesis